MKRRILSIFVVITVFLLGTSVFAVDETTDKTEEVITEAYVYKVVPGSKEWESFHGPEEKLAASYVPPETMEKMSTEALVKTVLNYPLLVDIYAYNSIEIGIQAVSTYFGGIEELMSRQDAAEVLYEYSLKETARTNDTDITYFYCDTLLDYISTEKAKESRAIQFTETTVETPNGSEVDAYYNLTWSNHGTSYAEVYAIDQQFLATYPSASIVANPSPSYNCHSYAWHSQSTSNKYWIDDPSLYMTDGSYSGCVVAIGCKVFYDSTNDLYNHSGVTTGLPSGGNPSVVTSKWGCHSLFSHYVDDCPYVNTGYSTVVGCWSRN